MLKLMTNTDNFMKGFPDYIVENVPENERASNDEAHVFRSKYSHILLVFDKINPLHVLVQEALMKGEIEILVTFIKQAMILWQKLQLGVTPKVHA
jgi:hypothetical protein